MTARPPVTPAPEWAFPRPTEWQLDNGLRVLAFDMPGQYVTSIRVGVPVPTAAEPRDLEGILLLVSRVFDEGTLDHDAETFAELLERSGAAIGSATTEYGLTLECDVPRTRLAAGLELFAEAVRRPAFPEEEVQRAIRRRLADIEQEKADPGTLAALTFAETFYDPDCRASRPSGGTGRTVNAVTAEHVRAFYHEHVGPTAATLTVAGDLGDLDEVRRLLAATFGAWVPQPGTPVPAQVPRRADGAERVVVLDRPGSVQTEIDLGCLAPARTSPDQWAPYPVLSFLVGGAPLARVDAVLREEKGYTYGIRSGVSARNGMSVFHTEGSVRADVTGDALRLLVDILDAGREGFTAQELRTGTDFVSKTAPARFATAEAVADQAVHLALEGRTTADITQTLQATRTLEVSALDAAYRTLDTDHWTIVLVGDADVIVPQLHEHGFDDLDVRR